MDQTLAQILSHLYALTAELQKAQARIKELEDQVPAPQGVA